MGITYYPEDHSPYVYSDSDFLQCSSTRCLIAGHVVMMSQGAVCWKSQCQSVVALSTTEAECSKYAVWVRSLMFDVFLPLKSRNPFSIDNTLAIFTETGEGIKTRSKNIDCLCHYFCDMVQSNQIERNHVSTDKMLADYLTKPLVLSSFSVALLLNNMQEKVP